MNMRTGDFNERELKELENELRDLGTPYSAEEPDSRYFANFRVRVMERIQEEEAAKVQTWYDRALGWIEEHVLVTSISTATALVALWAALMMQPLDQPAQRVASAPKVEQPQVQTPATTLPQNDVAVAQPESRPVAEKPQRAIVPHVNESVKHPLDMASLEMPAVSVADEVGPVSLDDLSAPELETVLSTLETE